MKQYAYTYLIFVTFTIQASLVLEAVYKAIDVAFPQFLENEDYPVLKEIINEGVGVISNLENRNTYGKTVLMIAAEHGDTDMVGQLIKAQVDLDTQDDHEYTAVMYAFKKLKFPVVKLLILAGANLNIETKDGYTAFLQPSGNEAVSRELQALVGN